MAVSLTTDVTDQGSEVLTVIESADIAAAEGRPAKRLAAVKDSQGTQHLARERSQPVKDGSGKRPKKDAAGKARKTEPVWKRTSALADMRDALASGLVVF